MSEQFERLESGIRDLGVGIKDLDLRMSHVEGHMAVVAKQTERTGDLLAEDFRWKRERAERQDTADDARATRQDEVKYKALSEVWAAVKIPLVVVLTALATMLAGGLGGSDVSTTVQAAPPEPMSIVAPAEPVEAPVDTVEHED